MLEHVQIIKERDIPKFAVLDFEEFRQMKKFAQGRSSQIFADIRRHKSLHIAVFIQIVDRTIGCEMVLIAIAELAQIADSVLTEFAQDLASIKDVFHGNHLFTTVIIEPFTLRTRLHFGHFISTTLPSPLNNNR